MNHTPNTPPRGNIPLPLAAVRQWNDAHTENTKESWAYVAGLLAGILIYRPDITEELVFLACISSQRGLMASKEAIDVKRTQLNASILQDLKKIPLDDLRLLAVIFMAVAENDITTLRSVSVPENVRPALDNLIGLIKGGVA